MNYHFDDVERLLASTPTLRSAKAALRYFRNAAQSGVELRSTLQQYPSVRYEPLEFFYICLQSLAVMNEALISDLTQFHGWYGKEWAAILVCFSPDAKYIPHLEMSAGTAGSHQWAAQAALEIVNRNAGGGRGELEQELHAIRLQLTSVSLPIIRLRPAPCRIFLEARAAEVRRAYRENGLEHALATLARIDTTQSLIPR